MHDFSEFLNIAIGQDGRFGYSSLPLYWRDPDRFPFLVRVEGELAGFILVKQCGSATSADQAVWDVAEFFVLRGYRRRGIGLEAALTLWRELPGQWQVRVREENRPAQEFWEAAVRKFAGDGRYSVDWRLANGGNWRVFSFLSPSEAQPIMEPRRS